MTMPLPPPIMTPQVKQYMVLCLCKSLQVLEKAAGIIDPLNFDSVTERTLAVLYGVARDFYREYKQLIPVPVLFAQVEQRVAADATFRASSYDMGELMNMLTLIQGCEAKDIHVPTAMKLVQDFIDERQIRPMLQTIQSNGQPINEAVATLQQLLRSTRVQTSQAIQAFDLASEDYDISPRTPLNFRPFDMLLGGGTRKGEVILCLGPIGGGKTLSSINCSIATARHARDPQDLSLYLTYEQPWNPIMRDRFFVGATGVSRTKIEGKRFEQMDSTTQDALQYMKQQIMSRLFVLDLSKSDGKSGDFCAGADGIINIINRYIADGRRVTHVYLDWLGAMVDSYRAAHSGKSREEKHQTMNSQIAALKQYINSVGSNLIVTHQLNSESGRKSNPFAKHSLYESADAKMIATMVDHCFTFGAIHRETQLMCIYNAKDSRSVGVQNVWCQVGKDNHQLSVPACQSYDVYSGADGWSISPRDDDSAYGLGAPTV